MEQNNRTLFGRMPDGRAVEQVTLRAGRRTCQIITYGGAVRSLTVPDRNGRAVDVALGFDSLEAYLSQDKYMGALIGRFANRIGGSRFTLNGREYPLYANEGANHLHGGRTGFDKQVWTVEQALADQLTLSLFSPDGQEGYPGDLTVRVTYRLTQSGLDIDYWARSERDTICGLTNHTYFNLSGHGSGTVDGHYIQIMASHYTPVDRELIPTGEIAPVRATPMDLRVPKRIGEAAVSGFPQLAWAGGYDHNWQIDGTPGSLRPAAHVFAADTGIRMEVWTTLPGIQFYTGNSLEGCPAGKGGARYGRRSGLCLEAQHFPDAPHHSQFPSAVLPQGVEYRHKTRYQFWAEAPAGSSVEGL